MVQHRTPPGGSGYEVVSIDSRGDFLGRLPVVARFGIAAKLLGMVSRMKDGGKNQRFYILKNLLRKEG